MDNEFNKTEAAVKAALANFLGVEIEDIEDDSTLSEDLHMKAADLTDFNEELKSKGFDTSGIDLAQIETFSELVEAITRGE